MKRKFLEDMGLTKEQIDSILDENSQDIGKVKGDSEKLKSAESEIEKLKNQLTERNKQLEMLKNSTEDVEGMKKQIETLQSENKKKDESHQAEIKQLKVESAIDNAINNSKGKNLKAIKSLLDMSKVDIDKDGNVIGHTEQIEALMKAEDSKFLFNIDESNQHQFKGANPIDGVKLEINDDLSKMSYDQLCKYMAENPNVTLN